jgi:hypothetical protein
VKTRDLAEVPKVEIIVEIKAESLKEEWPLQVSAPKRTFLRKVEKPLKVEEGAVVAEEIKAAEVNKLRF